MRMLSLLAAFLLSISAAASAVAQQTYLVGPGGFPTIIDAIQVASAGDFIIVQPGNYLGFSVGKGVTIRAQTPGTVNVAGFFTVVNVPPGETAHLVGLNWATSVVVLSGAATFDECNFRGNGDFLFFHNSKIYMQRCTVISGTLLPVSAAHSSLVCTNSFLSAIDSTFQGGASLKAGAATHAVWLSASTLHASHCTFVAGSGNPGVSAVLADTNSQLWLSDSLLSCDPPTCPLEINGASGQQVRCTLSPNCGALPFGPLLGVTRPQPLVRGGPFSVTFDGEPNAVIGIAFDSFVSRTRHPLLQQDLLLGPNLVGIGVAIADTQGLATVTYNIPLNPALENRWLWLQGVTGMTMPLQLSPAVGGIVR